MNKILQQLLSLSMATVILLSLAPSCSIAQTSTSDALPGKGLTIRAGTSDWVEERFQAEIVSIGLKRLGYKIAPIVEVAYPALFTAVANGDLDIAPVFEEPNHNLFFDNAGGAAKLEKIGKLFTFIQGYRIDKKTADRYQIKSIQQLQNPKLAQLFDAEGDGKADLVGCDPGWSCELVIEHHLDVYKLRDTVKVNKGNFTALIADALTRYREGKPILFFASEPFWLSQVLKTDKDVIWLDVPFTSYPAGMGTITAEDTTVNGKNLGMVRGYNRTLGNKAFLAANPAARRFFEQVQIPGVDVSQESFRIKQGENKPSDIRRHAEEWVQKNQALMQGWLAQASQTANQSNPGWSSPPTSAPNKVAPGLHALNILLNPFQLYTVPLDRVITAAINFLVNHFRPVFQTIRIPIAWMLQQIRNLLLVVPPLIFLILVCIITWRLAGRGAGIYSLIALTLIGFLGLWEAAMISLAIVATAVVICIGVGIPLGVVCARSDRVQQVLKPLLDAMQTLPTFVYLVPVVMLFGIGEVSGSIATIVYALPPLIRFTNLGIRQVSPDVVEAASAFGSTPRQILWEVQIPLALPTILAGINQTVLFALGMTVVASMIAVPGLGLTVLQGVGRLDVGTAAVGGLAIVLLAILLDWITQAIQPS